MTRLRTDNPLFTGTTGSTDMGKDKDTATVVLDDDLVKEIIEGGEGQSDDEGRVVRIDPAIREQGSPSSRVEEED
jgi:hypothetical protein